MIGAIIFNTVKIPYEVYDYVLANKNIINYAQLKEEFYDFLPLIEFEILFLDENNIFNNCAEKGYLNLLKYFHQKNYDWSKEQCILAAKDGHLDYLKYAKYAWGKDTCRLAAKNGHLDCLIFLHENGCPWGEETCYIAVKNGHLNCFKYAHKNGCPWDNMHNICNIAADNGHLDCLIYAHENGCP